MKSLLIAIAIRQKSLTEAKIMAMSKGFTIRRDLDLGSLLLQGYEKHRGHPPSPRNLTEDSQDLPELKIAAIANDAVATFVTSKYDLATMAGERVEMVSN